MKIKRNITKERRRKSKIKISVCDAFGVSGAVNSEFRLRVPTLIFFLLPLSVLRVSFQDLLRFAPYNNVNFEDNLLILTFLLSPYFSCV